MEHSSRSASDMGRGEAPVLGYLGGGQCRRKERGWGQECPPVASPPQSTGGRPSAQQQEAVAEVWSSPMGTGGGC